MSLRPFVKSIALLSLAIVLHAQAAYKCPGQSSVTYSDEPCTGGSQVVQTDLRTPDALQADHAAAKKRADHEKAQLKQLEDQRHSVERLDEKNRQRAFSSARTQQQRCSTLALRKKWSDEDATGIITRSTRKAKKKAHRLAEQYAVECVH